MKKMNIFRATKIENIECENQAKFVRERILVTEEKLAALCNAFGNYLQKNYRLRDANDEIASTIFKYSTDETVNKTLKYNLLQFAEYMAIIGDIRENQIIHIEQNVVKQFLQYNSRCHSAKAEVRNICSAKEVELGKRRQLGKIRQKDPQNKKIIVF